MSGVATPRSLVRLGHAMLDGFGSSELESGAAQGERGEEEEEDDADNVEPAAKAAPVATAAERREEVARSTLDLDGRSAGSRRHRDRRHRCA